MSFRRPLLLAAPAALIAGLVLASLLWLSSAAF